MKADNPRLVVANEMHQHQKLAVDDICRTLTLTVYVLPLLLLGKRGEATRQADVVQNCGVAPSLSVSPCGTREP